MFRNLTQNPPPPALVSQYLPIAYAAYREGRIGIAARPSWHMAHVSCACSMAIMRHFADRKCRPMPKLGRDEDELRALGRALDGSRDRAAACDVAQDARFGWSRRKDALERVSCAHCSIARQRG